MRTLILTTFFVVVAATLAQAQAQNSPPAFNSPANPTTTRPTVGEAPVGHRQPRAADMPRETSSADDPNKVDPADAALDRKIKGICRGC